MMRFLRPLLCTAVLVAIPAIGAPLSCPQYAPAQWKLANVALNAVRVLSYPADQPLVEGEALPIMAPFDEVERKGVVYQTWNMNFDAPNYRFQVDCLYSGTERYLRIDAPDVKLCTAMWGQRRKKFSFKCE